MATLNRVATVGQYRPTVTYPNNGFGQALQTVAGAMAKGIGTKVFFVQTGGFDTLVVSFSEFGRRVTENGSGGTDHGAASVMLAMGGGVRGGLYGSVPSLNPDPSNPTLENNASDVHYETDFRSVYAKVIDNWLGGNSAAVLGANFRANGIDFL